MSFFVTGFGPFSGCGDNPTQALIKLLSERLASGNHDPAFHVLGTAVLECAGQSVREWISDLYDARLAAAAADKPLVVLHMGVDVTGGHFKLEQQAVNEASFRVPDMAGWRPSRQLIDDHPGLTLSSRLLTDLDVSALAERLEQQRHDVRPSLDAGRYVCNFTFYLSLLHSQKQRQRRGRPIHALFLHVPPVAVVPLQQQFGFLLDLLQAIARQLEPAGSTGGTAAEALAEALADADLLASGGAAAAADVEPAAVQQAAS